MHGEESGLSILFKFINFGILVAILVKFAGKPLKKFFLERHERVKNEIETGKTTYAQIETLKAELQRKLEALDTEVEEIKKKVMEEAYAQRDMIISEAKAFAERLREQAILTKEQELKETRLMIREKIAEKCVDEAERIIRENLKKEDHDRLVRDFIERLRSVS
ncbi:MAG: ATP synthase F0 subunit B [Desulfobacterota bacterium]|nr:ATP synthase F0 subunit B [Thermodesulfobacteriota bacterium]MDW8001602.1 ATP synthase F0 subunit B [Deltaproteobacteria bacterium]